MRNVQLIHQINIKSYFVMARIILNSFFYCLAIICSYEKLIIDSFHDPFCFTANSKRRTNSIFLLFMYILYASERLPVPHHSTSLGCVQVRPSNQTESNEGGSFRQRLCIHYAPYNSSQNCPF